MRLALIDLGPNLGAINRAALIAADHIVMPLAADLFSLQGLQNAGPKLREWREGWRLRRKSWRGSELELPEGGMNPAGYVIMQHGERLDRPVRAYERWARRIPGIFARYVLGETNEPTQTRSERDPHCLGLVKHYRSLMSMAQEARKPMFHLKAADGAIGAHQKNVQVAYDNFRELGEAILKACGIDLPV